MTHSIKIERVHAHPARLRALLASSWRRERQQAGRRRPDGAGRSGAPRPPPRWLRRVGIQPEISDAMRRACSRPTSRGRPAWAPRHGRPPPCGHPNTRQTLVLPAGNNAGRPAETALGTGVIRDEHLAGEDVNHLVDAVLPAEAAFGAGPGDHRHGAVVAAGNGGRPRLRTTLQNPFRRKRRGNELDSGGICGDDVLRHGAPKIDAVAKVADKSLKIR